MDNITIGYVILDECRFVDGFVDGILLLLLTGLKVKVTDLALCLVFAS